jgi:phosphoribosylformylglycinamidine cyclo-ligase
MDSYQKSGVDVKKGEVFVDKIKTIVNSTYGDRVFQGVGGFASLYKMGNNKLIAASTDGVGTKLKIAQALNIHDTIGIDLVAMCVNDILCTGATPLFFLDYLATGSLNLATSEQIIAGITTGCLDAKMALIGGETAEMPSMYNPNEYDLAGFAIGEISENELIDGSKIDKDNAIIGIASSGFHSNGYSLLRQIVSPDETDLYQQLLTPTRIYSNLLCNMPSEVKKSITGIAHITGGGFTNIARLNKNYNYIINNLPELEQLPPIFKTIVNKSKLTFKEQYQTFNMGVGLAIITNNSAILSKYLDELNEQFWKLGQVDDGTGEVVIKSKKQNILLN